MFLPFNLTNYQQLISICFHSLIWLEVTFNNIRISFKYIRLDIVQLSFYMVALIAVATIQ